MTKQFKNVSPMGDLEVPLLGRVIAAGEIFTVPSEHLELFAAQPDNWRPVAGKKSAAAKSVATAAADESAASTTTEDQA